MINIRFFDQRDVTKTFSSPFFDIGNYLIRLVPSSAEQFDNGNISVSLPNGITLLFRGDDLALTDENIPDGTPDTILYRATGRENGTAKTVTLVSLTGDLPNYAEIKESVGNPDIQRAALLAFGEQSVVAIGSNARDSLQIGSGDDLVRGRGGADTIVVSGGGTDTILGGKGRDQLNLNTLDRKITVDLGTKEIVIGNDDAGVIRGVQDISGLSRGAKTLFGDKQDNAFKSGFDDDLLVGRRGNDRLDGDSGDDTLKGQSGDDTLIGGNGNDQLSGGRGADVFEFDNFDTGQNVVLDFSDEDQLVILGFGGGSFSAVAEGSDARVSLDDSSILLRNVDADSLVARDGDLGLIVELA